MISKTKYNLSYKDIYKIFEKAGISGANNIRPLGDGEFNAVFAVDGADGKGYALKVAPTVEVLPYEKGMLEAEVFWYNQMKDVINVPEIYFFDKSGDVIPTAWFIMERLDGVNPFKMELSKTEKREVNEELIRMCARIHKKHNDKFGYIQRGLYDTWYENIRSLTLEMIDCCKQKGHRSPRGEKLLSYIDKYKDILTDVECCMVNYDLWAPNIIAKRVDGKIKLWWIDPERSFWGDRMCDFVCFDIMDPMSKDKKWIYDAYNAVSDETVDETKKYQVRFAVMLCYMGLIMETEKYYRYTPTHFGWWRNVLADNLYYYKKGFKILKKLN